MKMKAKNKRLFARIKNWNDTIGRAWPQDSKVRLRCDSGGYHKPGSMKK